ncbi:MAG: YdbH domain-containing protein [Alphaproteobacteria bacterium]|nr:YdbH domain-containing protein [Alphaproteobacteria bacterium]
MPLQYIKRHRLKFSTLLLIIALGSAAVIIPWNILVQEKIKTLLAENGFVDSSLNLSHIGLRHIQIDALRLAKDAPALFDKLILHFSPIDLVSGHVRELNFTGLNLDLQQSQTGWAINGAALKSNKPAQPPATLAIPVSDAELANFPLDSVELKDSSIHVGSDAWKLEAPILIQFTKLPDNIIEATLPTISMVASGATLNAENLHAKLILDKTAQQWKGNWETDSISIKGQDSLIPSLKGSGTLIVSADTIVIDGNFNSADKTAHVSFHVNYPLNAPEKAQCHLIAAALPWNKGVISIKNAVIPLSGKDEFKMTLNVEHVPVHSLMTMLTGKETLATGVVSGNIPLTIKPDGQIAVGQGKLQTEQPGVITLNPETIPGDNEQIALVRDVMKNLHYNLLSISIDGDANKKLSVVMAVEGNNPDVAQGRPVKLSVHLTGDLLNFIQQSLLSLLDPQMFLKHATPK